MVVAFVFHNKDTDVVPYYKMAKSWKNRADPDNIKPGTKA